jgi:beta-mannosidase
MNMIRISGTTVYEADALYDELDAQGVLLWQDLMFANMDYPDDPGFVAGIEVELAQQLARLAHRPSLAIVCGNSEGEQQAAMWGTTRDRWSPRLFHEVIPARVAAACPGVPYVPSSATGGAFPHAANSGPSSYYGVGAYMRPLEDARRAEVRFASECLAFANIPGANMPHDPRSPRDLGAGWTFDDVRDHYMRVVFGVDPVALRVSDHERYLALGRIATGEVMAQTFGEWRRARSTCGGGLIWFLRDLQPGAGWGLVDASGAAKPCLYLLSRALAPIALAITDEGTNGLALHVANDRPAPHTGKLTLTLWRSGDVRVGHVEREVTVPAHGAIELAAAELFDGFYDLSYAYRFGRPVADVVHAQLVGTAAEAFWCPAGWSSAREPDVGLEVTGDASALAIRARRFALGVAIDAPGYVASDNYFHLAPGQVRTVALTGTGRLRATIAALNSEVGARFEPPVVASKS